MPSKIRLFFFNTIIIFTQKQISKRFFISYIEVQWTISHFGRFRFSKTNQNSTSIVQFKLKSIIPLITQHSNLKGNRTTNHNVRHIVEYLVQANGSNGLPIGGGSRGGRRGAPPVAAACGCGGRRGGAENETATRCSTKCARGGDDKSGVGVVKGKQVPEWVPQF